MMTPVAGQVVLMKSGSLIEKGTVTEITEQYVGVEPFPRENTVRGIIRFDPRTGKTGTCSEGLGFWEYIGPETGYLGMHPHTVPGTKFGPWELLL